MVLLSTCGATPSGKHGQNFGRSKLLVKSRTFWHGLLRPTYLPMVPEVYSCSVRTSVRLLLSFFWITLTEQKYTNWSVIIVITKEIVSQWTTEKVKWGKISTYWTVAHHDTSKCPKSAGMWDKFMEKGWKSYGKHLKNTDECLRGTSLPRALIVDD